MAVLALQGGAAVRRVRAAASTGLDSLAVAVMETAAAGKALVANEAVETGMAMAAGETGWEGLGWVVATGRAAWVGTAEAAGMEGVAMALEALGPGTVEEEAEDMEMVRAAMMVKVAKGVAAVAAVEMAVVAVVRAVAVTVEAARKAEARATVTRVVVTDTRVVEGAEEVWATAAEAMAMEARMGEVTAATQAVVEMVLTGVAWAAAAGMGM